MNVSPPTPLNTVKGQQVRRRLATALDFIQVYDVQAPLAPGVISWALCRPQGSSQGQSADSAHAIDSDPHHRLS